MTEHRASPVETADPDSATTTKVAILGTIILVIVIVSVQGLYERARRSEFQRKVVSEEPLQYRDLRKQQLVHLGETGWVDKKNGIVAIPIERAMALMVADPNPAAPVVAAQAPSAAAPDAKREPKR